ncbi:2,3-bisphosphoglycerate-independent phosphoglycerate mutase [Clostridium chauvoei]|uniref:Putative=2,3-bisphosphoglycerate-independent phosphoglycerate mutase, archaeal form n=2 Tax=Clostridium chauvoei TaxID=46867 RepID=S6F815_9CLOT|nr:2,3-bisphosphoglycerate-independent phosphoglycerate mutase [Clostridium chauvoei]CDG01173.1 Putative=2,3-bisphosphoglycerate-independent phosphoglycerate mutase, archaeal form [Clostridium chauvoei JF4335]MBX7281555.1 2,3-bisphosphoglycerate-independent phosphoglycerate mutase [Clostridium chauvoei]MBX7284075.1 2,3-bisphosphoglycerate-independent phosphoglycerate mutase [Clostridium chauvoei]MBX7286603.1 2,3-bisphosphoglycerate-independent phosphoglycerate mutase [Clostridium chauvoei]MBX7
MRKKQGLLMILDGLGDRPNLELNGMTPLEIAKTPNLDFLASQGMCGNVYPIAPGLRVGTDVGHLHIFGCDSNKVYSGRGPIEAYSAGIELMPGDVAFRGNFGTIDENYTVIDRRAGRIREGTKELAAAINGLILSDGTQVIVKELTEHRVAIVLRGNNLSDKISCTDPGTAVEGEKLVIPSPLDDTSSAAKTAKNLWEFTMRSYEILKEHPINKQRLSKELYVANAVITRGAGQKKYMPSIKELYNIKAACVAGDITVGGIAQLVGIDYFSNESFTGSFDTNLIGKADMAINLINEKSYNWVVMHIKATDLAGHDNLPIAKKDMIEKVDSIIGYILKKIDLNKCYIAVTADHSTPCEVRDHTGDGVPTIIAGGDVRKDSVNSAGESQFMSGSLNNLTANDIFMLQMDLLGFTEKVGS